MEEAKKKMTTAEAWEEIKRAFNLGVKQGQELIKLREAYRVVIASRIKSARMTTGMTQEEVSEKTLINALTYRGYENCRSDIPTVHLIRLADLFDVSMDYLTGRTDNSGAPDKQLEARISRIERELKIQE